MKKLISFLAVCLVSSAAVQAQSVQSCTDMLAAQLPGINLQVTSAAHHLDRQLPGGFGGPPQSLPAHCHIEGDIDRRTGVNDVSYGLRFAINMPDDWNGRFLFQGGGGLNGSLAEPVGGQFTGTQTALARGFAVVSTDSGHAGSVFDGSFMADQEAAMNFLFLGNMRVTNAAKVLVENYYSGAISNSYFVGCSTGGREGMIMAQRYPYLYDGIVSGAPAMRTGHSNLALRWVNVHFNQAKAELGMDMNQPGLFTLAEQTLIMDGFLESCDALDGAEDGLVFNMSACTFDPRELSCAAGQTDNCLHPVKAQALVTALAGPVDSRGIQVYSQFVMDTGLDDMGMGLPGILAAGGAPPEGPSTAGSLVMDVDAEDRQASAFDQSLGDATSYKLSSFYGNGGKQIFFHGVSDPWFSAMETLNYYQNMAAANGGLEAVNDASRLFMVPGMSHCAGGAQTLDNFDMLSAVVNWVEAGEAPDQIVATGNSMPGVSRPLCPHPQHPHYSGNGDINDAANFQCSE